MPIFKINGAKLKKLNSVPLDKEKNLQALVEANLRRGSKKRRT